MDYLQHLVFGRKDRLITISKIYLLSLNTPMNDVALEVTLTYYSSQLAITSLVHVSKRI